MNLLKYTGRLSQSQLRLLCWAMNARPDTWEVDIVPEGHRNKFTMSNVLFADRDTCIKQLKNLYARTNGLDYLFVLRILDPDFCREHCDNPYRILEVCETQ